MTVDRASGHLVAGRYQLKERLGRGGMGVVWRAFDTLLQRSVAVKTLQIPPLLDDADRARLRDRVLREARAAARLNHPGVVTVYDVVEDDDEPMIIMELVDSPNLSELVRRQGPLPPRRAAAIGLEVLDALVAAHAQGIVHRDVKPANVMVAEHGRVRLSDFGVAALLDDPMVTTSGAVAGSPSFMAPEQANSQPVGPPADVWALGATLYFAVEGEPPFDRGSAIATLTAIVNDEPRAARHAGALGPVLDRLLAKDPAGRPTADELRVLLADVAGQADDDWTAALDAGLLSEARRGAQRQTSAAGSPPPPTAAVPPTATVPGHERDGAPPTEPRPVPPPSSVSEPRQAPSPPVVTEPAPRWGGDERPPSPPPRRRPPSGDRARWVGAAVALAVVLALVGALLLSASGSDPDRTPAGPEAPATDPDDEPGTGPEEERASAAVPADWTPYTDPATRFTIARPPDWTVRVNGTLTDFVDPDTGAYLRVDHVQPPGPSPEGAWYEFEPRFAAQNPGYQRIRITPTTYAGFPAAIWEFTYGSGNRQRHAVDLGFVTGRYGFALNFDTPARDWRRLQPVFEAFKASFKPPPS